MKTTILLLGILLLQSCSVISYRMSLREEEKKDFEECYKMSHSYSLCKELSYSKMNNKHEILMSIKDKNGL